MDEERDTEIKELIYIVNHNGLLELVPTLQEAERYDSYTVHLKPKRPRRAKGFTLIELMTVIAIIGALASVSWANSGTGLSAFIKQYGETRIHLRSMVFGERALRQWDDIYTTNQSLGKSVTLGGEGQWFAACYYPSFRAIPGTHKASAADGKYFDACAAIGFEPDTAVYCTYANYPSWSEDIDRYRGVYGSYNDSDLEAYAYVNTALCDIDGDGIYTLQLELVQLNNEGLLMVTRRKTVEIASARQRGAEARKMRPGYTGT